MKPKIYIETTIPSYLVARPSNDIRVVANQNITLEWWETHRLNFDLYISEFVITEAGSGDPEVAQKRLKITKDISVLLTSNEVKELAKKLISEKAIPINAEVDAYHIAIAAINGIDYLMTWNCTHIANAIMRPKIEHICRLFGVEPPIICTPQEMMGG